MRVAAQLLAARSGWAFTGRQQDPKFNVTQIERVHHEDDRIGQGAQTHSEYGCSSIGSGHDQNQDNQSQESDQEGSPYEQMPNPFNKGIQGTLPTLLTFSAQNKTKV